MILWLVDASVKPTEEDRQIAALLARLPRRTPLVLAANKIDLVSAEVLPPHIEAYQARAAEETRRSSPSLPHKIKISINCESCWFRYLRSARRNTMKNR